MGELLVVSRSPQASGALERPETAPQRREDVLAAEQLRFVHINLFACICLQRFGFVSGGSEIYLCFIIFVLSSAWLIYRGAATFRTGVLTLFCLVVTSFTLSTVLALAAPRPGVGMSIMSLVGVILANAVFLVRPAGRVAPEATLRILVFYVRLCCVLGIVQYLAQFAGVRLFTLGTMIPALKPILVEANYNTEGLVAWGSVISRANGLFPLEPGGFSQLIAIGVLVDVLVLKRFRFVPLYAVAYVLTYSGTGLLCLALALAISPVLAPRQSKYVIIALVAAIPLLVGLYLLFPAQLSHLAERTTELQTPGTSGYLRYVAQQRAWSFFSEDWRFIIGSGPGAYERFEDYVRGSGSAAVKLYAEYGLVGLLLFTSFLLSAVWNWRLPLVSVMMLVTYQFGGGNLLQTPTLILMALLCVWSGVQATSGRSARGVRRAPSATGPDIDLLGAPSQLNGAPNLPGGTA